jgi:hypothetical protein
MTLGKMLHVRPIGERCSQDTQKEENCGSYTLSFVEDTRVDEGDFHALELGLAVL